MLPRGVRFHVCVRKTASWRQQEAKYHVQLEHTHFNLFILDLI